MWRCADQNQSKMICVISHIIYKPKSPNINKIKLLVFKTHVENRITLTFIFRVLFTNQYPITCIIFGYKLYAIEQIIIITFAKSIYILK